MLCEHEEVQKYQLKALGYRLHPPIFSCAGTLGLLTGLACMAKPHQKMQRIERLHKTARDFMRRAKRTKDEDVRGAYALMARSCYALADHVEQMTRKPFP